MIPTANQHTTNNPNVNPNNPIVNPKDLNENPFHNLIWNPVRNPNGNQNILNRNPIVNPNDPVRNPIVNPNDPVLYPFDPFHTLSLNPVNQEPIDQGTAILRGVGAFFTGGVSLLL